MHSYSRTIYFLPKEVQTNRSGAEKICTLQEQFHLDTRVVIVRDAFVQQYHVFPFLLKEVQMNRSGGRKNPYVALAGTISYICMYISFDMTQQFEKRKL